MAPPSRRALVPNALLKLPPEGRHRLRPETYRFFESVVGRRPEPRDYEGVHTTGDQAIAAAYAMGTWDQAGGADGVAYPVILTLDVSGLQPEPDVDAMMTGGLALRDIRPYVADMLDEGADTGEIAEAGEGDHPQSTAQVGDNPAAFIFDEIPRDPFRALIDALERETGGDEEAMMQCLRRFVADGVKALPPVVLSEVVQQQRYLLDFELDRLVRVEAFQPWWPEVMEPWWDTEDSADARKAHDIEAGGWRLWTLEDALYSRIAPDPSVVLYERGGGDTVAQEYHGTISTAVEAAFPGLIPANAPYPVDEEGGY